MWKLINDFNKKKKNVNKGPDNIDQNLFDSGVISSQSEIREYFNSYFSNVVSF